MSALARLVLHTFTHKDTTISFGLIAEYIIVYFGLCVGANKLTVPFTILRWGQLHGNTNNGSLYIKTNSEECLNLPSLLPDVYLHLGFTFSFSVTPSHVPGLQLFTSLSLTALHLSLSYRSSPLSLLQLFTSLSVFIDFFNKSVTTETFSLHLQSFGL